jgi:hypothetical protein
LFVSTLKKETLSSWNMRYEAGSKWPSPAAARATGGRSGGNKWKGQQEKKKKEYSGKATVNAAPAAAPPPAQPQHAFN